MANQVFNINSTLEKFESRDKDFRCMSLADLTVELGKDSLHLDAESERKLTKGILKLVSDSHSQVQELAVKTLGPFSKKLTKEAHLQEIVTTLTTHLQNEKKDSHEMRELASNAFKTVINAIDETTLGIVLVNTSTPLLIKGIKDFEKNQDIVFVSLDVLTTLLDRFVSKVQDKETLINVVQPQLKNKRQLSRKAAAICLGHIATTISHDLCTKLIANIVKGIQESKGDELRAYVSTISSISRSASERIGKFLNQIVPLLIQNCRTGDDNIRDDCLQSLETLILRCPREVTPFLKDIHDLCLEYIKLENVMEEDEEGSDMSEEEDEEDEEENVEEDEDDEDMSWKVRRAATKCLTALVSTRPEMISEIYDKTASALFSRFKREPEENVRADVYGAFVTLLRQANSVLRRDPDLSTKLQAIYADWGNKCGSSLSKFLKTKTKSVKGRAGGFNVLKELAAVSSNVFQDNFNTLSPAVQLALGDKGTEPELKREALQFLRAYFLSHTPKAVHPHLSGLGTLIFRAIKEKNAKIAADGLRAGCSLVAILRDSAVDAKPFLKDFYAAVLDKLKTVDTEVDVKVTSVTCMSLLISHFASDLKSEVPAIVDIFTQRVGNEITASAALRAFETLSSVQPRVELGSALDGVIKAVAQCLPITAVQQTASSALIHLIRTYGSEKPVADQFPAIVTAVTPFISDDLQLAHLGYVILSSILKHNPATANTMSDIFTRTTQLLRGQLAGQARQSLASFLANLLAADGKKLGFDDLHKALLGVIDKESPPRVISNVALGIGAICSTAKADKQDATVTKYEKDINSKDYHVKQLGFLVLGEVAGVSPSHHSKLLNLLIQHAGSADEGVRLVVADSLGRVLTASPKQTLPQYLEKLKSGNGLEKTVIMSSIRQAVLSVNQNLDADLQPSVSIILESLKDSELSVRKETTSLILALLRHRIHLIRDLIKNVIPQLFEETKLRPDLIKVIDLGNQKVTVDHAFENRVAAFECINLLLDLFPAYLDTKEFISNQLLDGLKDQQELVILSENALLKLINIPSAGAAIATVLDSLMDILINIITPPVDPKKKEEEKVMEASDEELLRLAFRIVSALSRLPETQGNAKLDEFLQKLASNADLTTKMKESETSKESGGHQSLRASRQ